ADRATGPDDAGARLDPEPRPQRSGAGRTTRRQSRESDARADRERRSAVRAARTDSRPRDTDRVGVPNGHDPARESTVDAYDPESLRHRWLGNERNSVCERERHDAPAQTSALSKLRWRIRLKRSFLRAQRAL